MRGPLSAPWFRVGVGEEGDGDAKETRGKQSGVLDGSKEAWAVTARGTSL